MLTEKALLVETITSLGEGFNDFDTIFCLVQNLVSCVLETSYENTTFPMFTFFNNLKHQRSVQVEAFKATVTSWLERNKIPQEQCQQIKKSFISLNVVEDYPAFEFNSITFLINAEHNSRINESPLTTPQSIICILEQLDPLFRKYGVHQYHAPSHRHCPILNHKLTNFPKNGGKQQN